MNILKINLTIDNKNYSAAIVQLFHLEHLIVNNDLVVKALDSSSLAMALLNTNNEITWSSPHFFELINNRKDLKQETILINLIKPLLTDLSFQHLKLAFRL
jgi:hypothetical protein